MWDVNTGLGLTLILHAVSGENGFYPGSHFHYNTEYKGHTQHTIHNTQHTNNRQQ